MDVVRGALWASIRSAVAMTPRLVRRYGWIAQW